MAANSEIVASAVVIPEPDPPAIALSPRDSPSTASHKRRQSSVSSQNAKRPRLDTSDSTVAPANGQATSFTASATPITPSETPTSAGTTENRSMRAAPTRDEERKRSKRLFGGVLGALSQKQSSTAQRRREDIERKQQEKLRAQEEEDEEEKRRKYEELMEIRRRSQWDWDEQSLSVRHGGMVARAEFLKTEARPSLYWLPFEMREAEEQRRDEQVKQVREACEDEKAAFDTRRKDALKDNSLQSGGVDQALNESENASENLSKVDESIDNANGAIDTAGPDGTDFDDAADKTKDADEMGMSKEDNQAKDTGDDHEEMVMEAGEGEDPVIY